LTVVLQSATRQDGGDKKSTRFNTRALVYDVTDPDALKLKAEYVVPLPTFKDAEGKTLVAAQSELAVLPDGRLLLLSRDSNNGWGVKGDTSLYRRRSSRFQPVPPTSPVVSSTARSRWHRRDSSIRR
jgi:hypothetical protein